MVRIAVYPSAKCFTFKVWDILPQSETGRTMRKSTVVTVTLETVLQAGLTLPGVERSTTFGAPALKVGGKLMACVPTHKSAEPNSFLFRMDRRERAPMIAELPILYYAPPHYQDYDAVLVRLDQLNPELLRDLLVMAHNFVTRKRKK
jgi:hypothetical protein